MLLYDHAESVAMFNLRFYYEKDYVEVLQLETSRVFEKIISDQMDIDN